MLACLKLYFCCNFCCEKECCLYPFRNNIILAFSTGVTVVVLILSVYEHESIVFMLLVAKINKKQ